MIVVSLNLSKREFDLYSSSKIHFVLLEFDLYSSSTKWILVQLRGNLT